MAQTVTVAPSLGAAVLMTTGGTGTSPGYGAIDIRRMSEAANSRREGVFDATGWSVVENGTPNMVIHVNANVGLARVQGTSVTGQGPYIVAPHSAVIDLDVTAAHATLPRLDMVVLQVRDNAHDASGSSDVRVRIIDGTATSGATLDNRTGAAALPASSLLLADVHVPALDTTIAQAQIRDYRLHAGNPDVGDIKMCATTPGPGWLLMDATNRNRLTHARLFAALSTSFGVGDGSTTFGVGDVRGRVLVAIDGAAGRMASNDALGNGSGAETTTLAAGNLPSNHYATSPGAFASTVGSVTSTGFNVATAVSGVTDTTGASTAFTNMPPYFVGGNYYIYAGALGAV